MEQNPFLCMIIMDMELHNRHEVNHNYINYSTMEKWKNLLTLNKVNAFESIYLWHSVYMYITVHC